MAESVLVVGAGAVQQPGICRAREMGYRVVATDGNPDAPGLALADVPVVLDVKDVDGTIDLAKRHRVVGVFCVAIEVAVRTVAAVAHALGLPGLTPEAARNAIDKQRMREAWSAGGLPSPVSVPCVSLEEAALAARRLGLPVVVKPADSAGSRGVSKVEARSDLPIAYEAARRCTASGTVLVEEFMEGVEMSVEGFAFRGGFHALAFSDKVRTPPPYLLDTTVLFPSTQPPAIQHRAAEIVAAGVKALGIDMAPVHAEVMVTPEGPQLVELAARGPGFKVFTEIIPWVCGVDTVRELIRMSVGETPDLIVGRSRGAVLRFPEAHTGTVEAVTGVEEAMKVPGVRDAEVYAKPGDWVRPLTSGSDRIGHIIALADSREAAEAAVTEAERRIRVRVRPARNGLFAAGGATERERSHE